MKQHSQLVLGVFAVLLAVYLLVFCGAANSDDEQLFAALTANLADHGSYSALQLFGNDRTRGGTGGVEPMHVLMGIPVYAVASLACVGKAQALHILPGFYTALTAALLAALAARRGYSRKTAALAGFVFGLCTIAFPYARTFFREPLAALWLTGALFCLDVLRRDPSDTPRVLISFLVMLDCLAGAALTKVTCLVCLPFFLLAAFLPLRRSRAWMVCLVGLGGTLIFYAAAWLVMSSQGLLPGLSRFTPDFASRMLLNMTRLPHQQFLAAVVGMVFSPGKGLLVYSPVLLLAGFSISRLQKDSSEWGDAILGIGCLTGLAAAQALVYDSEWWGITWGTRALLPVLPLLVVLCLPAFEQGLQHPDRSVRRLVAACLGLSMLIQVGRLLIPDPTYAVWLIRQTGQPISAATQWDMGAMPLWRHWALFLEGFPSDIAWLQLEAAPGWLVALALLAITALLAVGAWLLAGAQKNLCLGLLVIGMLVCLAVPLTLLAAKHDARYHWADESFRQMDAALCAQTGAGDLVLVDAYLKPVWWYTFNFSCNHVEWLGLTYEHYTATRNRIIYPRLYELEEIIRQRLGRGKHVFLIETASRDLMPYHEELADMGFQVEKVIKNIPDSQEATIFNIR